MISIDILYGWGIEHEWSCQDCAASCPKGYYGQGEHIIGDLANPRLHFCQLTLMRCLAYYNMLHVTLHVLICLRKYLPEVFERL